MSAQSLPVLRLGKRLITYSLDPSEAVERDGEPPRPMILVHEINGQIANQELVEELLRRPTFERKVWEQYDYLMLAQVLEQQIYFQRLAESIRKH